MNIETIVHPEDALALKALNNVPGFGTAAKLLLKFGVEQYCRSIYMSNHIRLSQKQLPLIYGMLETICDKVGIKVPELYLQAHPTPNAYTVGDQNPSIVVTSGLVDCLGVGSELEAVLAHECGHILCRHVYYTTVVQMMLNLASRIRALGAVLSTLQEPLLLAYNKWARVSEFSADRVSAVVLGNVATPVRTILRLAGGGMSSSALSQIDATAYVEQLMECERMKKDSKLQNLIKEFSEMDDDHPFTVTRVRELVMWGKSQGCRELASLKDNDCRKLGCVKRRAVKRLK